MTRQKQPHEVFYKKRYSQKFQALGSKKRFWHRCFPVNFAKLLRAPFLQNTFFTEQLWATASITITITISILFRIGFAFNTNQP